jgi:hypothetical protein
MAYPDMFLSIFFTFWVGVFVIAVSARAFALHKLAKRSRRRVQQREEVQPALSLSVSFECDDTCVWCLGLLSRVVLIEFIGSFYNNKNKQQFVVVLRRYSAVHCGEKNFRKKTRELLSSAPASL